MSQRKYTTTQFIEQCIILNPSCDYTKVVYTSKHSKVNIICPAHGEFSIEPIHFLRGSGCKQCGYITRANNKLNIHGTTCYNNSTKRKQTCLDRYGPSGFSQLASTKEKTIQTNILRYGTAHHNQSSIVRDRAALYGRKPIGHHTVQGYEPEAISYIASQNNIDINVDIITKSADMPHQFWYNIDGKNKRYFIDFFCVTTNTYYEVKSVYTWSANYTTNLVKLHSARDIHPNIKLLIVISSSDIREYGVDDLPPQTVV